MAKIGDMYLGGKTPDDPCSRPFPSGIAFRLARESNIDYMWSPEDSAWQVELRKHHTHVVARSFTAEEYDSFVAHGLEEIQRCLDIIAVRKLIISTLDHPDDDHIAVFHSGDNVILRHYSVSELGIKVTAHAEVRDKEGNIKPHVAAPEPVWTWAFRYYRLSQASRDIFEAYRNLFLSLEALLCLITPRWPSEREISWLKRALQHVAGMVQLAKYVPQGTVDPVDHLIQTQYVNTRCRLFHAKFPDALLPCDELSSTEVLDAYMVLIELWWSISVSYLRVPSAGGGFTRHGFKSMMDDTFKRPLSMCFTEDDSPPHKDDTEVSPLGATVLGFAESEYLSETRPGVVSWRGQTSVSDALSQIHVHRICTCLDGSLMWTSFISDGLSLSGVDTFQTLQSARLVNLGEPKTAF